MSSLPDKTDVAQATQVTITGDTVSVDLLDGRSVSVPLECSIIAELARAP